MLNLHFLVNQPLGLAFVQADKLAGGVGLRELYRIWLNVVWPPWGIDERHSERG